MNETRQRIPPIILAEPGSLAGLTDMAPCRSTVTIGNASNAADLAPVVHATIASMPGLSDALSTSLDLSVRDVLTAPDPHDAFFRVLRTEHTPEEAFVEGARQALAIWLDDHGSAEQAHRMASCAALVACELLAMIGNTEDGGLNHAARAAAAAVEDGAMRADCSPEVAVHRWVRGHQIFAVLTQGIIRQVVAIRRHAEQENIAALEKGMYRLAAQYDASSASLRLTADFPRRHYLDVIRPSMSEPHAPAGFSGSLSFDHSVMVRQLMQATAAFRLASERCPAAHECVKSALNALYACHHDVCDRLASADTPSIRSAALTRGPQSAGTVLNGFRDRRVALLS